MTRRGGVTSSAGTPNAAVNWRRGHVGGPRRQHSRRHLQVLRDRQHLGVDGGQPPVRQEQGHERRAVHFDSAHGLDHLHSDLVGRAGRRQRRLVHRLHGKVGRIDAKQGAVVEESAASSCPRSPSTSEGRHDGSDGRTGEQPAVTRPAVPEDLPPFPVPGLELVEAADRLRRTCSAGRQRRRRPRSCGPRPRPPARRARWARPGPRSRHARPTMTHRHDRSAPGPRMGRGSIPWL